MIHLVRALALAGAMLAAFPAAAGPAPDKPFTLTLTANEVGYIGRQLQERPYREVADLLSKIQGQLDAQNAAATAPTAASPAPAVPGTPPLQ